VALTLDITNSAQVVAAANAAADVDLLINNAGVASFSSILDGPRDLVERDMNTNYFGTLDMVRAFVPVLEAKKEAAIVNVVTIAAFANFPIVCHSYRVYLLETFPRSKTRAPVAQPTLRGLPVNPTQLQADTDQENDQQAQVGHFHNRIFD